MDDAHVVLHKHSASELLEPQPLSSASAASMFLSITHRACIEQSVEKQSDCKPSHYRNQHGASSGN